MVQCEHHLDLLISYDTHVITCEYDPKAAGNFDRALPKEAKTSARAAWD